MRFSQDFKIESLAFIAFFATVPLYSPNLVLFGDYGAAATLMPPFVNTMMAMAIIAGIACAWYALKRNAAVFSKSRMVIGAAILYLVGFALFIAGLGVEGFGNDVIMIAAGAAVSLGMVPSCIAWGTQLASLGLRHALLYLAVMLGVASFIDLMLSSMAVEAGLVAYALLLVVGVLPPCVKAVTGSLAHSVSHASGIAGDRELDAVVDESIGADEMNVLLGSVKRMASVAALPFIGLLVFAFVMGVRKFMVFDTFYAETLGGIVAALIVLPLCLVKTKRPLLSFLYQIFLPVCAVALIVLNSFPFGTTAQWLAASLSYVFYGVIGILALASLCAMAHAREFSSPFIYGLTVACFMIASLLGISCGAVPAFSDNAGPILLVISTAYFGFVVLAPLVSAWRREGAVEPGRGGPAGSDAQNQLQQRIEQTAVRYELSPRETETLAYLGRGHGIVFIAKTLVISESTVRSHVKSIYRKLEVSSREELLELIDTE